MSKARLIVLVIVLILGGIWFFTPQTVSQADGTEKAVPEEKIRDSQDPSPEDTQSSTSGNFQKRSTAQASPSPDATATDEPQAPGETALRALQAESIRPWTARRAGMNNGIKTLVRGRWTAGNLNDVRASATAFVHDYSDSLLGVPAEQVRFSKEETTDRTKIVYEQFVDGTRVYGSSLVLFFEDGGMTRVQNDLVSKNPTLSSAPTDFTATQAFAQFNASENSAYENVSPSAVKTVLFPGPTALVYSYDFVVRETATGKTFRVLYDAESQALIKKFPTQIR